MRGIHKLGAAALAVSLCLVPGVVSSRPKDRPVRTSPNWESEGVAGDGYLAWQENSRSRPARFDVFLKKPSGTVVKVNRPGTDAGMGGIDGGTLVYQEWRGHARPFARGSFSRIVFYDLKTGKRTVPPRANGPSWDYMPSVSGPWLFYGVYDRKGGRQAVGLNRNTGKRVTLDYTFGYLQPAQVSNGLFAWIHWERGFGPSEVRVYDVISGQTHYLGSRRWQWAPAIGPQGAVYVLETGRKCGSSPVFKRYAPALSGGYAGGVEVLRLPQGVDSSWSYAHSDAEDRPVIMHQRLRCGTRWGSDVYSFVDTVALTVAKDGSGEGTVTGEGIDCGEDCSETLDGGSYIELTAEPELTSHFAGWSRDCEVQEDENSCTFRVDEAQTVTATFDLGPLP